MILLNAFNLDQEQQANRMKEKAKLRDGITILLAVNVDYDCNIKAYASLEDVQLMALRGIKVAIDALNNL